MNIIFSSVKDGDSYRKSEVFHRVDELFMDDMNQLLYYKKERYSSSVPVAKLIECGDLVSEKVPSRENERIIYLNLGLALEDISTVPLVFQKARELGIGTILNL